jgi:hypothetical protein
MREGVNVRLSSFVVLAIKLTNGTCPTTDGSNGARYILVRDEGVKVIRRLTNVISTVTN